MSQFTHKTKQSLADRRCGVKCEYNMAEARLSEFADKVLRLKPCKLNLMEILFSLFIFYFCNDFSKVRQFYTVTCFFYLFYFIKGCFFPANSISLIRFVCHIKDVVISVYTKRCRTTESEILIFKHFHYHVGWESQLYFPVRA